MESEKDKDVINYQSNIGNLGNLPTQASFNRIAPRSSKSLIYGQSNGENSAFKIIEEAMGSNTQRIEELIEKYAATETQKELFYKNRRNWNRLKIVEITGPITDLGSQFLTQESNGSITLPTLDEQDVQLQVTSHHKVEGEGGFIPGTLEGDPDATFALKYRQGTIEGYLESQKYEKIIRYSHAGESKFLFVRELIAADSGHVLCDCSGSHSHP